MIRLTRALASALAGSFAAFALLLTPAFSLAGETTVDYTKESFPAFEQQLKAGQISSVVFNKRIRSMRITLKNGQHVVVMYPKHQSAPLITKLKAKHAAVSILSREQTKQEAKPSFPHKRRYIAGAIVVLVVIAIVVGVVVIRRRRRNLD